MLVPPNLAAIPKNLYDIETLNNIVEQVQYQNKELSASQQKIVELKVSLEKERQEKDALRTKCEKLEGDYYQLVNRLRDMELELNVYKSVSNDPQKSMLTLDPLAKVLERPTDPLGNILVSSSESVGTVAKETISTEHLAQLLEASERGSLAKSANSPVSEESINAAKQLKKVLSGDLSMFLKDEELQKVEIGEEVTTLFNKAKSCVQQIKKMDQDTKDALNALRLKQPASS